MSSYGQTIVQLQAQLTRARYSDTDREYLAHTYGLAADLFTGQFRGSGKTFIAHLVGTASILVAHGATAPLVAAGLLHAAYEQGDFGLGLSGRHVDKKTELTRTVGEEAEDYLERYFRLQWNRDTIMSLPARAATLTVTEQRVLLIRLANELEDHLDLGIQFCGNRAQRMARMDALGEDAVELARRLGYAALAEELSTAFADNRAAAVPLALKGQEAYSSLRIPRSCARRYVSRVRAYLSKLQ